MPGKAISHAIHALLGSIHHHDKLSEVVELITTHAPEDVQVLLGRPGFTFEDLFQINPCDTRSGGIYVDLLRLSTDTGEKNFNYTGSAKCFAMRWLTYDEVLRTGKPSEKCVHQSILATAGCHASIRPLLVFEPDNLPPPIFMLLAEGIFMIYLQSLRDFGTRGPHISQEMLDMFDRCIPEEVGMPIAQGTNMVWCLRQPFNARGVELSCKHCGMTVEKRAPWNPRSLGSIWCQACKSFFTHHHEVRPGKNIQQHMSNAAGIVVPCPETDCKYLMAQLQRHKLEYSEATRPARWSKTRGYHVCGPCANNLKRKGDMKAIAESEDEEFCGLCSKKLSDSERVLVRGRTEDGNKICVACCHQKQLESDFALPEGTLCANDHCKQVLAPTDRLAKRKIPEGTACSRRFKVFSEGNHKAKLRDPNDLGKRHFLWPGLFSDGTTYSVAMMCPAMELEVRIPEILQIQHDAHHFRCARIEAQDNFWL